jgi:hypothetical protein
LVRLRRDILPRTKFPTTTVGLSRDLDRTMAEPCERYVNRYSATADLSQRDDDEVWRGKFREVLERRHLTSYLAPKRIVATNYEYKFQQAWKNAIWRLY